MANKQPTGSTSAEQKNKQSKSINIKKIEKDPDYLYSMSMAPRIDESMHWLQMLPAAFFTAFIIVIVRMHTYERSMGQFYWTNNGDDLVDFFSYYKMLAITIIAVLALIFLLYRVFSQSLFIKKSPLYIPMIVYSVFVLISYFMSDYKDFALLGFNDRFEGTVPLLCYMIMLFFTINTVNSEKNIRWIVMPVAISSIYLSLLGLSQALDHDFFQTTLGKKMITPSWYWDQLDSLTFTFTNKEIYQTVFNINYVSFYLTLLIPIFGLLFIHSVMMGKDEPIWKKILWGGLFALNLYNLIGSQSSGGILGMAVVVAIALIVLNKTILKWLKPVAVLLAITVIIGGVTYERWLPEIVGATHGVLGIEASEPKEIPGTPVDDTDTATGEQTPSQKGYIDYIETSGNDINLSYNGNAITFTTYPENPLAIKLTDGDGKDLEIALVEGTTGSFVIDDERFSSFVIGPAQDSAGVNYFVLKIDDREWPFALIQGQGILHRNDLGKFTALHKVEAMGWANNLDFGSGRGYIWSRTLPMMKDTMLLGHGADTYCIYYPHNDYVGKYNADWELNMIVDKPHNMYMGAWIGTGGISVIALLVLWFMYIAQSIQVFWKRRIESYTEYAGLGIFLGVCGFLVSGLVDDSSVSVMPMFYGLLGTGIAINMMLKRQQVKEK